MLLALDYMGKRAFVPGAAEAQLHQKMPRYADDILRVEPHSLLATAASPGDALIVEDCQTTHEGAPCGRASTVMTWEREKSSPIYRVS